MSNLNIVSPVLINYGECVFSTPCLSYHIRITTHSVYECDSECRQKSVSCWQNNGLHDRDYQWTRVEHELHGFDKTTWKRGSWGWRRRRTGVRPFVRICDDHGGGNPRQRTGTCDIPLPICYGTADVGKRFQSHVRCPCCFLCSQSRTLTAYLLGKTEEMNDSRRTLLGSALWMNLNGDINSPEIYHWLMYSIQVHLTSGIKQGRGIHIFKCK